MAEWFVVRKGKEHGPFQDAQLKSLATSGKLKEEDSVRRSDQKSTVTAKSIGGLFGPALSLESPPPAAPTPAPSPATAAKKSGIWMKVVYFLMFCVIVSQVLKMIGLMTGDKNNQQVASKESPEKVADGASVPVTDPQSLAIGRPQAAEFIAYLNKRHKFELSTPPNGIPTAGSAYANLAPDPSRPSRLYAAAKQDFDWKPRLSLLAIEDTESGKLTSVILGIPFSLKPDDKKDIGPLDEIVSYILPECSVRGLMREQTAALISGGSATQTCGKAQVRMNYKRNEMQVFIAVEE
jgi:hypothetical protein